MDDYRCEICGGGGHVVGAILFGPNGEQIPVVVHIVCENSRVARMAEQRAKAWTN